MEDKQELWSDKKRTFLGLPLSFTRYTLTNEKLIIRTGFFNKREEEIRLYKIDDITLTRSLGERILGLGTIHCISSDLSTPEFRIFRIKSSEDVKNYISDLAEHQRNERYEKMGFFANPPARAPLPHMDGGPIDMHNRNY